MYCGRCGVLNGDNAKFCKTCGTSMTFEQKRGEFGPSFFAITIYVMLGFVIFSLLYYVLTNNSDERLRNKENIYSIVNYNTL